MLVGWVSVTLATTRETEVEEAKRTRQRMSNSFNNCTDSRLSTKSSAAEANWSFLLSLSIFACCCWYYLCTKVGHQQRALAKRHHWKTSMNIVNGSVSFRQQPMVFHLTHHSSCQDYNTIHLIYHSLSSARWFEKNTQLARIKLTAVH